MAVATRRRRSMKKRVKRKTMKPKYGKKVMRSRRRKSLQKRRRMKTNRRKRRGGFGFTDTGRKKLYEKGLSIDPEPLFDKLTNKLKENNFNPYGYTKKTMLGQSNVKDVIYNTDMSGASFNNWEDANSARNFIVTVARVSLTDNEVANKAKTFVLKGKYKIGKFENTYYVYNVDTGTYYKNSLKELVEQYLEKAKEMHNNGEINFKVDGKLGREALGRMVGLLTYFKEKVDFEKSTFTNIEVIKKETQ